jgi:hypothetical protein
MQERDRFIQAELKANSMIWYAKSMWQLGLANSVHFSNSVWQFYSAIEIRQFSLSFSNSVWLFSLSLAFQFGISVWQFSLAIQFGSFVW